MINPESIRISVVDGVPMVNCSSLVEATGFGFLEDKALLTPADLLSYWYRYSLSYPEEAPDLTALVDQVLDLMPQTERESFVWLCAGIKFEVYSHFTGRLGEIGRVHSWFKENAGDAIPGATIVSRRGRQGIGKPDFWVEIEGLLYPVECKLRFDNKALKQLQRYILGWNTFKGFAVAPEVKCGIPANITFIQCP